MPTAYTGPGWEHPERKKMPISGSIADYYIHDGFTVAAIVEAGFIDQKHVNARRDIAVYSPVDEHQSTPMAWVSDLDEAEKFIAAQRQAHPDWPTVPVPLAVLIPTYKTTGDVRDAIREIVEVLEAREDLQLHGYNVWTIARWLFVHCQGMFIGQKSIDRALELAAIAADRWDGED